MENFNIKYKILKQVVPELLFLNGKPREDTKYLGFVAYSPEYSDPQSYSGLVTCYRVYKYRRGYWEYTAKISPRDFELIYKAYHGRDKVS